MSEDTRPAGITRREALSRIALVLGGTFVGAEFLFNGTRLEGKEAGPDFTPGELELMDEIAETIIPATDTPGAKAAGAAAFMALVVKDCYTVDQEAKFRAGLLEIDKECSSEFGKGFMDATPADRTALLTKLDAKERNLKAPGRAQGSFALIKQLAVVSYFTSETGCTQSMRFQESPGLFVGCAPYQQGEPGWFSTVARAIDVAK